MHVVNEFFAGKEMIQAGEVAKRLGVHINTVHHWIERGVGIPYHVVPNFGRIFDWGQVSLWAEACKNYKPPANPYKTDAELKAEREASFARTVAAAKATLEAAEKLRAKEAA
ncbi:MAG: hypothetical protein FIA96_08740 [Betaproteobacteria bacterium]|nr:hypothetical protein [Betaproteobacteria bacterium]